MCVERGGREEKEKKRNFKLGKKTRKNRNIRKKSYASFHGAEINFLFFYFWTQFLLMILSAKTITKIFLKDL